MMGDEGKPVKKLKKTVKVKKAERPPANPVVDVSIINFEAKKTNFQTFPNTALVIGKPILPYIVFSID